jgi:hypothetical protein
VRLTRVLPTLQGEKNPLANHFHTRANIDSEGREWQGILLAGLEGRGGLGRENGQRSLESKSLMDWTNLDRVLVLTGEGVDGSLLDTLLALRQALVPRRRGRLAQFVRRQSRLENRGRNG